MVYYELVGDMSLDFRRVLKPNIQIFVSSTQGTGSNNSEIEFQSERRREKPRREFPD